MKTSIIILLIFLITNQASAQYQEQELEPATMRALAPKQKSYPVLEALEAELYPHKNFSKEAPQKRLERIEIASFGEIQSGSIKQRIEKLKLELQNWQIAQAQNPSPKTQQASTPRPQSAQNYFPRASYQAPRQTQAQKKPDYDYLNYRLTSPLVQNLGRKGIEKIFKDKKWN